MEVINRYVTIKHHINDALKESDYEAKTVTLSLSLKSGSNAVLVKDSDESIDPYQLNRMKEYNSSHMASIYTLSLSAGEAINAYGVGRVVESDHPRFEKNDVIVGLIGWEEYSVIPRGAMIRKLETSEFPFSYHVGPLGLSGYMQGFLVCKPKKGDKVFVSAVSGLVGKIVGQYTKLFGCYVVGCAGSKHKVDLLKEKLSFDDAFNYKEGAEFKSTLKIYFPDGIDVYFDNVGGEMLEAAIDNMNSFGRVAVCGVISEYTNAKRCAGPNMLDVVYKRITIQGFLVVDYMHEFGNFLSATSDHLRGDKMQVLEHISIGLKSIPSAFKGLFTGDNVGKKIVKISDV